MRRKVLAMWKQWMPIWVALWMGWAGSSSLAHAKLLEAPCLVLLQQKKWVPAARCFEQKAATLSQDQKVYRGNMLQNAALLWERAAKSVAQSDALKAPIYLQRAILRFDTYLVQKLCAEPAQCQKIQSYRDLLCTRAGCSRVEIHSVPSPATIEVRAQDWQQTQKGAWSHTLPPGLYHVFARADGFRQKYLKLTVSAKRVINIKVQLEQIPAPVAPRAPVAPPKPPPVPIFVWIGSIAGGAILVAGGVLVGTGYVRRNDFIKRTWQNETQNSNSALKQEALQGPEATAITGVAMLAGGAGLAVAGLVVFFVTRKPSAPSKQVKLPIPSASPLFASP